MLDSHLKKNMDLFFVDTSFCSNYHGSSASKRKKTYRGKKKVAQDSFRGGCFLSSNFGPIFDLLNVIILTFSRTGYLFKIKFSSQVALNCAIFMDGLKVTN